MSGLKTREIDLGNGETLRVLDSRIVKTAGNK